MDRTSRRSRDRPWRATCPVFGVSIAVGSADSRTPLPPLRTSNLCPAYRQGIRTSTRRPPAIFNASAAVAVPMTSRSPSSLSIHTSSSTVRAASSLCVTAPHRRMVRSGSTRPRNVVPSRAQRSGPGPVVDQRREQAHAHVARRDHAGQPLPARRLVVGEAREVVVDGARIGAHLILRQEELDGAQVVSLEDVVEAHRRHAQPSPRYIMRLSTVGDQLATLVRHGEADDDEDHAAAATGLLVEIVQRGDDRDAVARRGSARRARCPCRRRSSCAPAVLREACRGRTGCRGTGCSRSGDR